MASDSTGSGEGMQLTASSGSGGTTCISIKEWNPSPSELPPDYYEADTNVQPVSDGWDWSYASPYYIQDVYVAPTIDDVVPYTLGASRSAGDYNGTNCYSQGMVHFNSPGVYTVKVDYRDPALTDRITFLHLGSKPPTDEARIKDSRQKRIPVPSASPGAFIIETPDLDNGAIGIAADIIDGEVRAASVDSAINSLISAYDMNNKQPIDAVLFGHGSPNNISVGDGRTSPGQVLELGRQ
ncbi:MAG: hypothetical protein WKF75_02875 [Singulisphaera sp.]